MKPHTILIACLGLLAVSCQTNPQNATQTASMDVMTFNIRYGLANDAGDSWEFRKALVLEVIRQESPDLIGLQEALRFQVDAIRERFPEYGEIGIGRDPGGEGEYSAILYRKERFEAGDSSTFWLSDTPETPSAHWGNRYLRICTWARFLDRETGEHFYFYNTHFDHESQPSRNNSALLLAKTMANRAHRDPVIVTGDFNAGEDYPSVTYLTGKVSPLGESPILLQDTFRQLHPREKTVGTFNSFIGNTVGPKIDYVFVTPELQASEAAIITFSRDGRFPSDHYPVTARIHIPEAYKQKK